MRDIPLLNQTMSEIGSAHNGLDGLIAAAGIQQETPTLEYTAEDANRMLEVNITGCFMAAQATAKEMIRFGKGGSIVMIASMSGHVANRVRSLLLSFFLTLNRSLIGTDMPRLQRLQSRCLAASPQPRQRVGRA
jgi:NAD(P)-dependent dehydrogenase (short-subunit alcohol dehydrogenase family)